MVTKKQIEAVVKTINMWKSPRFRKYDKRKPPPSIKKDYLEKDLGLRGDESPLLCCFLCEEFGCAICPLDPCMYFLEDEDKITGRKYLYAKYLNAWNTADEEEMSKQADNIVETCQKWLKEHDRQ